MSQIVVPPSIHTAALEAVLDTVLELSKKRIWLREECGWILYQLLVKLSNRPYGEAYCKVVIEKVDAHGLIKSLEGVLLWITALKLFPKIELPRRVFHQQDPLNKKEKTTLIRVLKANAVLDTTNDEQSEASTRSIWSSNLHFAWDILLSTLDDDDVPNRVQFAEVWTEAVDRKSIRSKNL